MDMVPILLLFSILLGLVLIIVKVLVEERRLRELHSRGEHVARSMAALLLDTRVEGGRIPEEKLAEFRSLLEGLPKVPFVRRAEKALNKYEKALRSGRGREEVFAKLVGFVTSYLLLMAVAEPGIAEIIKRWLRKFSLSPDVNELLSGVAVEVLSALQPER